MTYAIEPFTLDEIPNDPIKMVDYLTELIEYAKTPQGENLLFLYKHADAMTEVFYTGKDTLLSHKGALDEVHATLSGAEVRLDDIIGEMDCTQNQNDKDRIDRFAGDLREAEKTVKQLLDDLGYLD